MHSKSIPVSLYRCDSYTEEDVYEKMGQCLEAAQLSLPPRSKILVKPNFLMANKLACTHPFIICAICHWLLDNGHLPVVADSPAFGTAKRIAAFLGLDIMLKQLGVPLEEMDRPTAMPIKLPDGKHEIINISRRALETDIIFSVPKIKAHSQMRMTLAVKNCFGCVPGPRKAFLHTKCGNTHHEFAGWLAAIWKALPPVMAVCDGIVAMSDTGPAKGIPYNLNLIGACSSAHILDTAILETLHIPLEKVPLTKLVQENMIITPAISYPLAKPADFPGQSFKIPQTLQSASFQLPRLFKSFIRRWWAQKKTNPS